MFETVFLITWLIAAIIVGIILLIFASKISGFTYNFYKQLAEDSKDNIIGIWAGSYLRVKPVFYTWLFRIIGVGFICVSAFVLIWVYILGN